MRVLVTGVGGSAGQNLVACLRLAGHSIVGVDANQYHLAAADADKRYLVPPTEQLEAWLDLMQHLARGVDVILPQPDCDVWALATNRHLFEGQLRLPDTKAIEVCQDKLRTAWAIGDGSVASRSWEGPETAAAMLEEHGAPIWLRARQGAGGRGSMKAYSVEEAKSWLDYCRRAKGIQPSEFQVCAYLPGREFAVQQIWNGGRLIVSQARERVEYLFGYLSPTGQTSTPAVARTVRRADVTVLATSAVQAIAERPHGVFGVDVKEDAGGAPRVTEINAGRFYTTSNFFAAAGLNLPELLLVQTIGVAGEPLVDPLEPDLYWIRTMDRQPQLVPAAALEDGLSFRTLAVTKKPTRKIAPPYRKKPASAPVKK